MEIRVLSGREKGGVTVKGSEIKAGMVFYENGAMSDDDKFLALTDMFEEGASGNNVVLALGMAGDFDVGSSNSAHSVITIYENTEMTVVGVAEYIYIDIGEITKYKEKPV